MRRGTGGGILKVMGSVGGSLVSDEELEEIIEKARIDRITRLYLGSSKITKLPESIGNLLNLTHLNLRDNQLVDLPRGICNLLNLTYLNLSKNQFVKLPQDIESLRNLTELRLPENKIDNLPKFIGNLSKLTHLDVSNNQIKKLPISISNLSNLCFLDLSENHNRLLYLYSSKIMWSSYEVKPSKYYFDEVNDWKSEWLIHEENAHIRRELIQGIGYERIYHELKASELDTWGEYTLLSIDDMFEDSYPRDSPLDYEEIDDDDEVDDDEIPEPMVLLKMTCPSTGHIHILRVPPEMTSAETAITWVNHGIHPEEFAVQT